MTGQIFTDAQQAVGFATPALYRMHSTVFEEKYPAFDYATYMPVNEDGDMWDVGTIVTSLNGPAGRAEYISAKGFDIPNVSKQMSQGVTNFFLAGCGYELSLQEVNRASKMGVDLASRDASDARKIAEKFIFDRGMTGSTEKGFTGLINNGGVPTANVPADGTGSATAWSTKDADKKVRDVNLAITDVFTNTKETEMADTLLLPTSSFLDASTARVGDTGMTVLAYIQANNAYTAISRQPLNILPMQWLETAGASSTKRMIAYARNPGVLEFFLPGAFTFMPMHPISSLAWRVDGIMNVGQLEIYRPKAVSYRDGI
ncbi:conserved hypothetical protein [Sphingobium sp. SYK-6]|uniref:DUF2184 domain-containing protein n=1 Tax=Sphingobium sp. (strain NBRC 103272 / SYK-6) TaxID=627192 RepID=UPI000227712E|nr:DUF2184 domain-containing protein [Sphingobium sp. SYK-6]BAK66882.1 conserved hypothetical protein [Sphingobium sp. SYK-6]